jgi:hypothetical protein
MPEQLTHEDSRLLRGESYADTEPREAPGLMDGLRYLYQRRVGLAVRFVAFFSLGVIAFLVFYLTAPTSVQGTLGLSFRGIERSEYPSGRKFTVEDFRSPGVLTSALTDAGVRSENLGRVSAGIVITPIIPADVQGRWKKQEKDGARKDEYFPSEFHIGVQMSGLSTAQELRLFDAIVKSYQARVKYEQKAALGFVASGSEMSFDKAAARYDFWDIPPLFQETYKSLDREVKALIAESLQYPDAKYQLGFRNIARELNNWQAIRLSALEAATYQGRLVKNKDLAIQRVQYRVEDIDLQIKQKTNEANEAIRLLGRLDRSSSLVAGQLATDKSLPVVDIGALERLLKSDYVAPVVAKVSKLQSEAQELETEKGRLQKQLAFLPKAVNVDPKELPRGYKELVETVSSELRSIVEDYNRFLDEYLTASVTSLVAIKRSPIVIREVYSPILALIGIVFLSAFMAIVMMSVEHVFQKVKSQVAPARM